LPGPGAGGSGGASSASGGSASETTAGSTGASSGAGGQAQGAGGTAPSAGTAGTGAGAGGTGTIHDHCLNGYLPHPSDSDPNMKDGPADFYPPGNTSPDIVDTTVQPQVIEFMTENKWQAAHVEWHAIRACNVPGGGGFSKVNICKFTQLVPKNQNCQTPGDGYEFLVFHRHMIQALKQLWPNHSEQFTGFTKFPTKAEDVPPQWRSAWEDWPPEVLEAGLIGDNIDDPENLAKFPDEGTLGFWLQCNVGQVLPGGPPDMPWVGLHFVLHAKWARPGNTRHGVNNTESNIDNYMFWKLHGWIDNVWEKYRLAKGLQPDDPKLQADLVASCQEMDIEIQIIRDNLKPDDLPDPNEPLPVESGFFHDKVRPIFESQKNKCSGCHAESGANAKLSLGGHISSKAIVAALVDKPSRSGGQYKLVVPGDPDNSWLYRKASDTAKTANCQPSATAQCITGVMPPAMTGPTLTSAELETLRQWILDGAKGPPN
jgi:hypothetical protein